MEKNFAVDSLVSYLFAMNQEEPIAAKSTRPGSVVTVEKMPWEDRIYVVLVCLFTTLLVLTNIVGVKLFELTLPFAVFGHDVVTLPTGLLTYPLTFLVTDVVSEIYGRKRADVMVWLGFAMSLLMLGIVQLTIAIDPASHWAAASGLKLAYFENSQGMQDGWRAVFGLGPWLVSGSMCAYLVAQLCDNRLFHFWRELTQGKHLWLRNNGSTIVSQLLDTLIVNSFLFYGAFGWDFVFGIKVMVGVYLVKVMIALLDTPFCYLAVAMIRQFLRRQTLNSK